MTVLSKLEVDRDSGEKKKLESGLGSQKKSTSGGRLYIAKGSGAEDQTGVMEPVLLPCGHGLFCEAGEEVKVEDAVCRVGQMKEFPCGHQFIVECSVYHKYFKDMKKCPLPCTVSMACGHECPSSCHIAEDENHTTPEYWCKVPCKKHIRKTCPKEIHGGCFDGSHECGAPCPLCHEEITYDLKCGHKLTRLCQEGDPREDGYVCQETCRRKLPNCWHHCPKPCGVDCGPCKQAAGRSLRSCPYRHDNIVPCFQKENRGALDLMHCMMKMTPQEKDPRTGKYMPKQNCGHALIEVRCHEQDILSTADINYKCKEPCSATLTSDPNCLHKCTGNCGECFQYRWHKRCQAPCGKTLICNHECSSPCGAGCPPCTLTCIRSCAHKRCDKICGRACRWECKEECVYQCEHGRCTQPCDQICNKTPCLEPCSKVLVCGHPCVGFCGEPCPPYCRICDKQELMKGVLLSLNEIDEDDRFVYLEACGHAVESEAMDNWMRQGADGGEAGDEEILPKRCPVCRTRLGWIHRYSQVMHENWSLIEAVKEKTFGKDEAISAAVEDVREMLVVANSKALKKFKSGVTCLYQGILSKVQLMLEPAELAKMSLDMVTFLFWVVEQWNYAATKASNFIGLEYEEDMQNMLGRWDELFEFLEKREWPLQKVEKDAYYMERYRLDGYTKLYSVLVEGRKKDDEYYTRMRFGEVGEKLFGRALGLLHRSNNPEYTRSVEREFNALFDVFQGHMKVTIAVSDEERVEIVKAFGDGSGRWFKCPNGHVYVITECGGAMDEARCPECNAVIGGFNHRVNRGNHLAHEMDGAVQPMFTEAMAEAADRVMWEVEEAERRLLWQEW